MYRLVAYVKARQHESYPFLTRTIEESEDAAALISTLADWIASLEEPRRASFYLWKLATDRQRSELPLLFRNY